MNPLYEIVQDLKNRIAKGEISGYTALDLFFQHVDGCVTEPAPSGATAEINPIPSGPGLIDPATIDAPVVAYSAPEPAADAPADGLPADSITE